MMKTKTRARLRCDERIIQLLQNSSLCLLEDKDK